MGTDIHGVWQAQNAGGEWEDIPHPLGWDHQRNYQLFAVLAGVRNGRGFTGVLFGEAVTPIAEPRGLPDGFVVDHGMQHPTMIEALHPWGAEYCRKYPEDGIHEWMGSDDFSWLTVDEMLAWYETAPTVRRCGVMSVKDYRTWDRAGAPRDYCGGISGRGIITCEESQIPDTPNATHVRVWWSVRLADDLRHFFDVVKEMKDKYPGQQVRFVFGFDS